MIRIGEFQELEIMRITSVGAYLSSGDDSDVDEILLPTSQIPEGADVGDKVNVFIYKDSEDRVIATSKTPKIAIGQVRALSVRDTNDYGAFLNWGLNKDLLLPFSEQRGEVRKGKKYVVSLYVDNSNRLAATMDVYSRLSSESPYSKGESVSGIVYEVNEKYGAFVAVDEKYHGMIPKAGIFEEMAPGDEVTARVKKVRDDGKLELSLREEAYKEIDSDAERIMDLLAKGDGILNLGDKSDPEEIKKVLKMSKKAFKRAVGRLYKEKKITVGDHSIEMVE